MFSRLQTRPHQVGPQVDQTNLGAGHVGDGVDGVEDGVLPGKPQSCSDQRAPSQARQRSQQWGVFEESAEWVAGGGGGGGEDGADEEGEESCDCVSVRDHLVFSAG